jgi:glycosyltransferase involved in cell wall biosynthesis
LNREVKTICLITPNHISTNPRLVKEAIALEKEGFNVHLIFTQFDSFATKLDKAILDEHTKWKYDVLNWGGDNLFSFVYRFGFGLSKKLSERIFSVYPEETLANLILNRNYFWQVRKAIAANADIYIAHNLGALPVARVAAQKLNVKYGFDAEDFHRNEICNNPTDKDVIIKSFVEEKNLSKLSHFTAASPLIGKAYQELYPNLIPSVILNVFPKVNPLIRKPRQLSNLKLFWFSQTIGEDRGIETIIHAIGKFKKAIFELHLLGNPIEGYKERIAMLANELKLEQQIFFYDPVPEKEIFNLAAKFDFGMASETGFPLNRDICLTNKIFTYIQSGLAVVASDTTGQKEFMESNAFCGKIYKRNNVESLLSVLEYYYENQEEMEKCKDYNFQLGQAKLNWEVEQFKFLESVKNALSRTNKKHITF